MACATPTDSSRVSAVAGRAVPMLRMARLMSSSSECSVFYFVTTRTVLPLNLAPKVKMRGKHRTSGSVPCTATGRIAH